MSQSEFSPQALAAYQATRAPEQQHRLCHAPWRSMYIGHLGKVVPCCANRSYSYGRFPLQSLTEIWNGQLIGQMRAAIAEGNLKMGCQVCEKGIVSGKHGPLKTYNYDRVSETNHAQWPTRIEFELDNTCNLECIMCNGTFSSSIRKNRDKLPPLENPYDDTFLEQLDPFLTHLDEADFYGGEPFMIEVYLKIWERLLEVNFGCQVYVQTNGTIFTQRVRAIVQRLRMNIGISFDSAVPATYEQIRVNANYQKVVANIEAIVEIQRSKGQNTYLSKCLMANNWLELDAYYRFAQRLQLPIYLHYLQKPSHFAVSGLDSDTLLNGSSQLQEWLKTEQPQTRLDAENLKRIQDAVQVVLHWNLEKPGYIRQTPHFIEKITFLLKGELKFFTNSLPIKNKPTRDLLTPLDSFNQFIELTKATRSKYEVAKELANLAETLEYDPEYGPLVHAMFHYLTGEEIKRTFDANSIEAMERAADVVRERALST